MDYTTPLTLTPNTPDRGREAYQCPACDGTGVLWEYAVRCTCYVCNGTGVVRRDKVDPQKAYSEITNARSIVLHE